MYSIIDFDKHRLNDAVELLQRNQEYFLGSFGDDIFLTQNKFRSILELALEEEVSTASMVLVGNRVVGFMIAQVKEDSFWGRRGWIDLAHWSVDPDFLSCTEALYSQAAKEWIALGVIEHVIFVFDGDIDNKARLHSLGFAPEQTYAILSLERFSASAISNSEGVECRRAGTEDREVIKGFSRTIASFQSQSPCFAYSPQGYLEALDKGYSELPDDDEAEIYLAFHNKEAAGIEVFYPEEPHLLIPKDSVELCVGAVREKFRGTGVGSELTRFALANQADRGRRYITTDWRIANPLSSRFWPRIGFSPVAHRFVRRLDSRYSESTKSFDRGSRD